MVYNGLRWHRVTGHPALKYPFVSKVRHARTQTHLLFEEFLKGGHGPEKAWAPCGAKFTFAVLIEFLC